MSEYALIQKMPSIEDYLNIRKRTLGEKTKIAGEMVVRNSWFGVHIVFEEKTVGMGRFIGDGGCSFSITDIAVLPEHQGQGLGKMIMEALMKHYKEFGPKDGYLTLIADGNAKFLYKKYGFEETAPYAIGMKYNNK